MLISVPGSSEVLNSALSLKIEFLIHYTEHYYGVHVIMTEGAEIRAPATAAAMLTQEEQNKQEDADAIKEGAYIATHYDGQLPAPTGSVANAVNAKMSPEAQRNQAGDFFCFINSVQSGLRDLNGDEHFFSTGCSTCHQQGDWG